MSANNSDPLILMGEGYELAISPDAEELKRKLLAVADDVVTVSSNDDSAKAQFVLRQLSAVRIATDKCRTTIKAPVLAVGKKIDQTAKDYLDEVVEAEKRISHLIGAHAEQVEKDRQIRKQAEALAFQAAREAREAAELAASKAEATGQADDVATAREAEGEWRESLAEKMDASAEVVAARQTDGVRFAWDFEVVSLPMLYAAAPGFVDLSVRRAEILYWIKTAAITTDEKKLIDSLLQIGIRAYKRPIVSTR